jgi:uncharacterized RDD family membrane protein YckC
MYCARCGQAIPESAQFCPKCGQQVAAAGQAAASVAGVTAPKVSFRYAGFWRRLLASIIDDIVLILGAFVLGLVEGLILPRDAVASAGYWLFSFAQMALVGWLYYALMESSAQQGTMGKMTLDIRVTDMAGRRVGFGQATGRHFGKLISGLILGIGFLMAAFTQRKQGLHDMLASCLVVQARSEGTETL